MSENTVVMLTRGRTRYRMQVAACAVLFTLSVFGAYLHQAMALHGYCTDHGELIHLKRLHQHHVEDGKRPVATPALDLEGRHGCAILHFLTQTSSVHSTGFAVVAFCPSQVAPVGHGLADLSSVPLLLQSPKTSPPLC